MISREVRERLQRQESNVNNLVEEIAVLKASIIELQATRQAYERSLLISDERYDRLLATHLEATKAFQQVAEQYTDGLARARATIASLEVTNNELAQPFSNRPLHMTEEEEDLTWQLDHGVLSMTEYNEALRASGLAD